MKNIFIAGLQRTGTNYAETLINKNINVNVFWGTSKFNDSKDDFALWKHNVAPIDDAIKEEYNIDGVVLVIKNPYSWIESIVYRNYIDIISSYNEKYNLLENLEGKIYRNSIQFRIDSLCRLYKDFYSNWLSNNVFLIRYEDLLSNKEKVFENLIDEFNLLYKVDEIKELDDVVIHSEDFDYARISKYIDVDLQYLTQKEIKTINQELGKCFFNTIGYEML